MNKKDFLIQAINEPEYKYMGKYKGCDSWQRVGDSYDYKYLYVTQHWFWLEILLFKSDTEESIEYNYWFWQYRPLIKQLKSKLIK